MERMRGKRLPIGFDSFYDVRSRDLCYVDKTFFIQRLLDSEAYAMLFTRPRRFGKSLALSMLRRFFDCNEKEKNRPLFDGLTVAQSERHMAEQGKYPVIFLNFKTAKADARPELEKMLHRVLYKAFIPFEYLLQSNKLSAAEKDYLHKLIFQDVTVNELSTSCDFICSLLAKHHGQPVVILIDEYDAPLQSAYTYGFYQPICDIMRNLFSSALKSNENLRLGVITGVLRIAKDSLFSGLNNLQVDTILSDHYADCFGFTQAEVNQVASNYGVTEKIDEIKEWYDGYRFGNQDIYNPWSVLQYFYNRCNPTAYWVDTSSNDLVIEALHRLSETEHRGVKDLCEDGYVEATIDTSVTFTQLKSEDTNILYSLMAVSGYLKPTERLLDDLYRLVIPNKEIKKIYRDEILSHLQHNLRFHKLTNLRSAIIRGEEQKISELLNEYILASLSYYDTVEKFYHVWMMGLLFVMHEEYVCQSNREAGHGRPDIVLTPRPGRDLPGVIFELKHCDKPEQLQAKAEEALQQIEDRNYSAGLTPEVKEVLKYGIAFCGKECYIATPL